MTNSLIYRIDLANAEKEIRATAIKLIDSSFIESNRRASGMDVSQVNPLLLKKYSSV